MNIASAIRTDLVQDYRSAWNVHDGAAVAGLFTAGGTYVDPSLDGPVRGDGIAAVVAAVVESFPDVHFTSERPLVDGLTTVLRWRMHGTNTGPFPGSAEPTQAVCDLPGVDVITTSPDGILSVVGYFDQHTLAEQLGLRTTLLPQDEGPMSFGGAARMDVGDTTVPGAISMTWIESADDGERDEIDLLAFAIVEQLSLEPGFIGWLGTTVDRRGHTLTAWSSPEAAESALSTVPAHRAAMRDFLGGTIATRGFTSLWVPHRINRQWGRCPECGTRTAIATGLESVTCECGGEVAVTPYL
jgi:hypothetical protein